MTLLAFQLALAELSTSLEACERVVADPAAALASYDLTPVERRRLESAARQHGMRVNVSLYRYNRITTLVTVLPGTIHLLGARARAVVDEFWAGRAPDRNMRRESEHFAACVLRMIGEGRLEVPYLRETVEFELARYQVAVAPAGPLLAAVDEAAARWPEGPLALHPLARVAAFTHDPLPLLAHLAWKHPPPYDDVAEGEFYLLLDYRTGGLEQRPLDLSTGRMLHAGSGIDAGAPGAARLLAEGILVRTQPAEVAHASR